MGRFTGKVAVVTGAKDTQAAVERAGATTLAIEPDVTRWDDVQRYTTAATERFGAIDVFFNNAGILGDVSPLIEYSEATFDRVLAVNIKGVWLGLKAVAAVMAARGGGAIVNTASVAGLRASPTLGPYSASKHAVIGLTRTAAVELARRGIRVNAVCPAPIDTPMVRQFEAGLGEGAHERLLARILRGGRRGRRARRFSAQRRCLLRQRRHLHGGRRVDGLSPTPAPHAPGERLHYFVDLRIWTVHGTPAKPLK
jgi:NAD(P)-dependent dehydrogenase (short-subunit alcohol dehydrogenase family)